MTRTTQGLVPHIYSLMFTVVKSQDHLSGRRKTTFLTSRDEAQDLGNVEKAGCFGSKIIPACCLVSSAFLRTACCSTYCWYWDRLSLPCILWLGFKACDWKFLSIVNSLLRCTSVYQEKTEVEVCRAKQGKVKTLFSCKRSDILSSLLLCKPFY